MDYESKDLSNSIHTKEHTYEEKMRDATVTALISKLKLAITEIKKDLKEHSLEEGVMNSLLFSCADMRRG